MNATINDRLEAILVGGGGLCAQPGDMNFHTHIENPESLVKPDSVLAYERAAAAAISRLTTMIDDLQAYRMALGQRYGYLISAPTVPVVKLTMEFDGKRTYYYIKTFRRYDNGMEYEESGRQFLDSELSMAILEFNEYKRSHPGIIAESDIEEMN